MTQPEGAEFEGSIPADEDEHRVNIRRRRRRQRRRRQRRRRAAVRRPCANSADDPPTSSDIINLLQTQLTVGPEIAGRAFGLGRSSSYAACRNGQIPAFKIGGKFACPTAPLRRMLGIDEHRAAESPLASPPIPPPPPPPEKSASAKGGATRTARRRRASAREAEAAARDDTAAYLTEKGD